MGLRGQLAGREGLAVVVWRRQLQGGLVVRQRHAWREVHLYTVMDVFLFDEAAGRCCRTEEVGSETWKVQRDKKAPTEGQMHKLTITSEED